MCRWNKRENFPAALQEILTGFLVVLYVVVVVCVDNARPLFFAKSFYKLHHRRHTDTAASKLSTSSKQVINDNEIEKIDISGVALNILDIRGKVVRKKEGP